MAIIYDRVVSLISKDPSHREDRDVQLLVHWFTNLSELFKTQSSDVVQDLVRNCEFRSVPEDTIIIRQGDYGNCFYIILRGSVSIYINQALEDEDNVKTIPSTQKAELQQRQKISDVEGNTNEYQQRKLDSVPNDAEQELKGSSEKKLQCEDNFVSASSEEFEESDGNDIPDVFESHGWRVERKLLGSHIKDLGAGQSFGELALVHSNCRRNATVISDVNTDLIVVNRDLYNRSLKTAQQQEFKEKLEFVHNLTLFKALTPRLKNVMSMSLTPVHYQYGNTIMKQGETSRGMVFLLSGQVKISMDPIQQIQQYSWLCTEKELQFAKDIRNGVESRFPGHPVASSNDLRGLPKITKRRRSYADAEREANQKMLHVCIIGPNECIGDTEMLLKLPSSTCTVQCLEPVVALELNLNNFERIISKRSPNTLTQMRQMAEVKLRARVSRLANNEQTNCTIMFRLLDAIAEQNTPLHVKIARRKEEERSAILSVLKVPSWHNYRKKQRQFLMKREQEKRQRKRQIERLEYFSRMTYRMSQKEFESGNCLDQDTSEDGSLDVAESISRLAIDKDMAQSVSRLDIDKDVAQSVSRLTIDMPSSMPSSLPVQRNPIACTHDSESILPSYLNKGHNPNSRRFSASL